MKKFIDEQPLLVACLSILISIILLIYRLRKNDTFRMKDYGLTEWRLMIRMWGLIVLLFMLGVYLITCNICLVVLK